MRRNSEMKNSVVELYESGVVDRALGDAIHPGGTMVPRTNLAVIILIRVLSRKRIKSLSNFITAKMPKIERKIKIKQPKPL